MRLDSRSIVVALLIVGLAASLLVGVQRYRVEQNNRDVEIVVDYGEIEDLAASQDTDAGSVLAMFRLAGATGAAVSEQTIGDAVEHFVLVPRGENVFEGTSTVVLRAASQLSELGIEATVEVVSTEDGTRSRLHLPSEYPGSYIMQLPIGLPEQALSAAKAADMEVTARLTNFPGACPDAIDAIIKDAKAKGIDKVVFDGDQVLGFKGAVESTAQALAAHHVAFGRVEFAKQKGEVALAVSAPANTIIVHSITQNEMPTLDVPAIVERFQKAVKERGVRMCYVRLYDTASENVLQDNLSYVSSIAQGIRSAGYRLGPLSTLSEVNASTGLRILAGAGAAAGVMLLVLMLFSLSKTAAAVWTVVLAAVFGVPAGLGPAGQKAAALLAAVVFPTLAALYASRGGPPEHSGTRSVILGAVGRTAAALVICGAGAALIVGLLSQRAFMLRTDQFAGVKLAHVLPLLLLTVLFAGEIAWSRDSWAVQCGRLREAFRRLGRSPILIWQAAGLLLVVVLVGLMVARSGNDSGIGISSLELKFRSLLDRMLLVRPRTKEIFIGYPALVAGTAFALRGCRRWAAPLIVVGTIGLVSAVNSFCHIHTPLAISILRTINGAIVGTVFGVILYILVRNLPGIEAPAGKDG